MSQLELVLAILLLYSSSWTYFLSYKRCLIELSQVSGFHQRSTSKHALDNVNRGYQSPCCQY